MHEIEPLPAGCPWADWARPNLKWCEELQCSYVVTPSNAYSNAAYALAALLMKVYLDRAHSASHSRPFSPRGGSHWPLLSCFPMTALFCGFCSFLYHASYTLVFQYADFLGMFSFLSIPITIGLQETFPRAFSAPPRYTALVVTLLSTLLVPVLHLLRMKFQLLIALQITAVIALEASNKRGLTAHFFQSLFFMAVAASLSAMDQNGIFCHPPSLVQGHALWHAFSALGMLCLVCHMADTRM